LHNILVGAFAAMRLTAEISIVRVEGEQLL
jgi:hypothetical protein